MKPFALLVEKELRETLYSTRFIITFSLSALLILLTFYVSIRDFKLSSERYEAAVKENLRKMEGQTNWSMVRDHRIYLPPSLLMSLVGGISNDIGRQITMVGTGELYARDSRYSEEPALAVFRLLDLNFLFQMILSLVAIVFAFNAVSGEKESATLALIFSGSISRAQFLLAKMTGAYLSLVIPLMIPFLLALLMIPAMGASMPSDDWIRLLLILLLGVLYLGVFIALSVAVSAFTEKSANSFSILLAVWILAVLIVPKASVMIAARAVEVPNLDAIAKEKNQYRMQLWKESQERMAAFKPTTASDKPDEFMKEFESFMGKETERREGLFGLLAKRLNENRFNREKRREDIALSLARVSPAAVFSLAASSLAGTNLLLKNYFNESAIAYQSIFAEFMKSKTGQKGGSGIVFRIEDGNSTPPKPIDVSELPVFTFRGAPLSESIQSATLDAALLLFYSSAFILVAYRRFLRYDLR